MALPDRNFGSSCAITEPLTQQHQICGEITIIPQYDRKVYALHCSYCPDMHLQLDTFIQHIEQQHQEQLNIRENNITNRCNDEINSINGLLKDESISNIEKNLCEVESYYNGDSNTRSTILNLGCLNNFSQTNKAEYETTNGSNINVEEIISGKLPKLEQHIERTTVILQSLAEEIHQIKSITNKNHNDSNHSQFASEFGELKGFIHNQSFETVQDLLEYDKIFTDPQKNQVLSESFCKIIAPTSSAFVFKCWRSLMKDNVAKCLNWTGTGDKYSVRQLSCLVAIKNAFVKKYPFEPLEVCTQKTKKFFLYAGARLTQKIKCAT